MGRLFPPFLLQLHASDTTNEIAADPNFSSADIFDVTLHTLIDSDSPAQLLK